MLEMVKYPQPLVGVWREQHYFFSPCFGSVMDNRHGKQIYSLDVEMGFYLKEDGSKSPCAVFIFIGCKPSKDPSTFPVGKKTLPIYFATVSHPNLIESDSEHHGVTWNDIIEFGQHPEDVKKEVLQVLSKLLYFSVSIFVIQS